MVRGFFADVVARIGVPELQDRLMGSIETRLGALPGLAINTDEASNTDEQPVEVA